MSTPRKSGSGWLALILIVGTAIGIMAFLPLVPCPFCRGKVFQERMRMASAPGIDPMHASRIRAFAESDTCGSCKLGRMTMVAFWSRFR